MKPNLGAAILPLMVHATLVIACWLVVRSAAAMAATNSPALERLFSAAAEQHSHALFVYQHGQSVRTQLFEGRERRIYLYSITKLFSGLAIGIAWDKGLIPSIEEPIGSYFPEANHDPLKQRINIRHLLQHTSGIHTTAAPATSIRSEIS